MLIRTKVREDVRLLLVNNTNAGPRVSKSRSTPWGEQELPAIDIFTTSETGESIGQNNVFRKTLTVTMRCQVGELDDDAADTNLDTLCEQVETLILSDAAFCSQFEHLPTLSTQLERTPDGAIVPTSALIELTVVYVEDYAPTIADDLATIAADWDMAQPRNDPQIPPGPDGQIDAQDELQNLDL